MIKRIFALFCCLLLLSVPFLPIVSRAEASLVLVSIGDSIPNGYGLSDKNTAYPVLIAERLGAEGIYCAKDGITSTGILSALEQGLYDEALQDADVITLSVGGNDFLSKLNTDAFYTFLRGDPSALQGIADVGVLTLTENFPLILQRIREKATGAKLIVQTVYNPYMAFSTVAVGGTVFSDFVDTQIERLNQIIRSYVDADKNIYLCEVHGAFSSAGDLSFVNAKPSPLMIDPHPSLRGHQAIADEMWRVLLSLDIASEDGLGAFLKPTEDDERPSVDLPEIPSVTPEHESKDEPTVPEMPQEDDDRQDDDSRGCWLWILSAAGALIVIVIVIAYKANNKR